MPFVLILAIWAAAEGGETLHILLSAGGAAALGATLLTAVWYGLKLSRLSRPTCSAIVGALAFPGPLWFALTVYTRGGVS
ncbi:hypothetical protein CTZ27_09720 [Streptomyces griseocarneus]|nr:hypothetical protein CTZ27_09720 [Streptomyces griseocarneus]